MESVREEAELAHSSRVSALSCLRTRRDSLRETANPRQARKARKAWKVREAREAPEGAQGRKHAGKIRPAHFNFPSLKYHFHGIQLANRII